MLENLLMLKRTNIDDDDYVFMVNRRNKYDHKGKCLSLNCVADCRFAARKENKREGQVQV